MFSQILDSAIQQTDVRILEYPAYGAYIYAKDELLKIKNLSASGLIPTFETNLGLMTAKELEVDDPEYADLLYQISYAVRSDK